jgi:serine/threonine protein phosphatase PrpC
VTPEEWDRTPASHRSDDRPHRPPGAQRLLLIAMALFLCVALLAAIEKVVVAALAAVVVGLIAGLWFSVGVVEKSGRRGWPVGIMKRLRGPGAADDAPAGTPAPPGHPREPAGSEPPSVPGENPATRRGPVPPIGQALGPGRDTGQAPSGRADRRPSSAPALAIAEEPAPPCSLPEPPVFAGPSAPGQAPWHLPVDAAPSGLAADAARLGDLEVRAASMVGAGHRCQEPAGPRQDAYALGRTPDGRYLIIAVADGVSQSRRSDLGARVAVSTAARELGRMLSAGPMDAIDVDLLYNVVAGEMLGTGRDRGVPDEDVCSILIVAAIPALARRDGTRPMWASWIGDVSLWIHREGDLHRVTGEEKTGLDRNTLTAVLPFNPDQVENNYFELRPSDRVALVTDGMSDTWSTIPAAADFFTRQWAAPAPHPAAFLHSLCYDGPGQTDDRTAVVVWCGPDEPVPGARRRP